MKTYLSAILALFLALACLAPELAANGAKESAAPGKNVEEITMTNKIKITVGRRSMTAVLENNASASALLKLMESGPITVKGSNYGDFEKVCALGASLVKNDTFLTTKPGDIVLYQGKFICFYYAENSWDFTPLGHVQNLSDAEIREIFSGPETEVSLERLP